VGLDWTLDIGEARRRVGDQVALQGNLDPCALHGTPDSIRTEVARIIDGYGNHPGHVFNLGHGISQFTDPDKVGVLVEAVHSQSRALRASSGT
jgi:uroporphyrinogen decarboxylase